MIAKRYIARWMKYAPWKSPLQVEQDLVISRALIDLFSDDFINETLAFRGGTALHKLYLNPSPRYSEDIDLVQIKPGPIKPIMKRIGELLDYFKEDRITKQKRSNNTIIYRFNSSYFAEERLRLKIEINCREHFSILGWKKFPFVMKNEWFSGQAEITTYELDELLGTKLRALYQRKKGRDLFDLFYAQHKTKIDYNKILRCYYRYIEFSTGKKPPTRKQFIRNMEEKMSDPEFKGDMEGLLRQGIDYNQNKAFEWLFENIIEQME